MTTLRLRGNTFVLLLLRASVNELSERPEWGESHNGITRYNFFADLIRLIDPNYSPLKTETLSSYFSKYLKGDMPFSQKYFPFNSSFYQTGLQMRIENDYFAVLADMDRFCKTYIQKTDGVLRHLVGGLVEAILADVTFDGSFDVGDRWVDKTKLSETTEFSLLPFLVSVWNIIVSKYPDASEGAETYKHWTNHVDNTPDEITTHIGKDTAMRIKVRVELSKSVEVPLKDTEQNLGEKKGPAERAAEPETVEAEVIDGTPYIEKKTFVKEGRVYNQNAQTIINIENLESLRV